MRRVARRTRGGTEESPAAEIIIQVVANGY